jgi:anti-sigma factor RsiW
MTSTPIADDVRRFVLLAIPSVSYLEALLLMRSTAEQTWNAAQLARRLYLGEKTAAGQLAALNEADIAAAHPDGFQYRPRDAQLAGLLDSLAAAYARHLVEISLLIHTKNEGKPQHFANAFLWRRRR